VSVVSEEYVTLFIVLVRRLGLTSLGLLGMTLGLGLISDNKQLIF
jgi:hypothetical protein